MSLLANALFKDGSNSASSSHYTEVGVRCRYLHSEIETLERIRLLLDLRKGEYDVVIGINLLRENLDVPEVSLAASLNADQEGFFRSQCSLIQTIARAAITSKAAPFPSADEVQRFNRPGN